MSLKKVPNPYFLSIEKSHGVVEPGARVLDGTGGSDPLRGPDGLKTSNNLTNSRGITIMTISI